MAQWISFNTIRKPFHDPRTGKILNDISGRKNRPGIDPFAPGGNVYPDLVISSKIKTWFQAGTDVMVLIDEPAGQIDKILSKISHTSPPTDVAPPLCTSYKSSANGTASSSNFPSVRFLISASTSALGLPILLELALI